MNVKHKRLVKQGVIVSNICPGTMNFGWHTSEEDSFRDQASGSSRGNDTDI